MPILVAAPMPILVAAPMPILVAAPAPGITVAGLKPRGAPVTDFPIGIAAPPSTRGAVLATLGPAGSINGGAEALG